jgi:hypothetical protein
MLSQPHSTRPVNPLALQVEQCVGTLAFLMSEHRTPEQMHASMGQLATSRLSPKKMRVVCIDIGHIGHSDHGLAQYFARPDYRHVWSKVKVLSLETWCYEQLLQASCLPLTASTSTFSHISGMVSLIE